MAKVATTIRLDADVKDSAQAVLKELGLDLSTAIGIFLRQTIREQRIPFEVKIDVPNAETRGALDEIREMQAHPEKYKGYGSFDDLLKEALGDASD